MGISGIRGTATQCEASSSRKGAGPESNTRLFNARALICVRTLKVATKRLRLEIGIELQFIICGPASFIIGTALSLFGSH